MAAFDRFGDYMFDLLFAPLKRGKKAANQLYVFLKVVGRMFDESKEEILRTREESSVISCSDVMLPVQGQDRDMVRLKGETLEGYRTRLTMKGIIAEKAGTNEGIRYLAKAFGYDHVEIEKPSDPERWAEATVQFIGGKIVLDDEALLLQELDKIKPARTLLTLSKEQRYSGTIYAGTAYVIGKQLTLKQE